MPCSTWMCEKGLSGSRILLLRVFNGLNLTEPETKSAHAFFYKKSSTSSIFIEPAAMGQLTHAVIKSLQRTQFLLSLKLWASSRMLL
jgi:hypothetical protein